MTGAHATLYAEPHALRVMSTLLSVCVSLLSLNTCLGALWFHSHRTLGLMFSPLERRAMLVQYLFALPLFELLVVWGSSVDASISANSSSVLACHVVVLTLSLVLLALAQCSLVHVRSYVYIAQAMRISLVVFVACDRATRAVLGYEGMVLAIMLVCAMFEVLHVRPTFEIAPRDSTASEDVALRSLAHRQDTAACSSDDDDSGTLTFGENFDANVPLTARAHLKTQRADAALADILARVSRVNVLAMTGAEAKKMIGDLKRSMTSAGVSNSTSSVSGGMSNRLRETPPRHRRPSAHAPVADDLSEF